MSVLRKVKFVEHSPKIELIEMRKIRRKVIEGGLPTIVKNGKTEEREKSGPFLKQELSAICRSSGSITCTLAYYAVSQPSEEYN